MKSNVIVGVMALIILLASWLVTETRLRAYVAYPWLEDRAAVLGLLDSIEARAARLEEKVETLQSVSLTIDARTQRLEEKVERLQILALPRAPE